jgi:hypothetical protein
MKRLSNTIEYNKFFHIFRVFNATLFKGKNGMIRNVLLVVCVLAATGCYTQFAALDRRSPPGLQPEVMVDSSTGDTVKVVSQPETVVAREGETCVWERDAFGRPELRCYQSNFSHDWYLYNNYPWWYNQGPYYYDYSGRCPRYYFYDNSCGQCRYYSNYESYRYRHNPSYYPSSGYAPSGSAPSSHPAKGVKADAATIKRDTRATGEKTYLHRVTGKPKQAEVKKQAASDDSSNAPAPSSAPQQQYGGQQAITPVPETQQQAVPVQPSPQPQVQEKPADNGSQPQQQGNKDVPQEQKPKRSLRGR